MNLTDAILLILVLALVFFCGKKSMGHFKGESACCGGGSTIIEEDKKLAGPIKGKYTLDVEGMSCSNCEARVKRAINSIDHASGTVSLKNNNAIVEYDEDIDINNVIKKIEKAGYKAKVSE